MSARAGVAPTQFVSGDDVVGPAFADQNAPAIARGGDVSLAVWSDARALAPLGVGFAEGETSRDIYGVRIDSSGNVLDATPIAITAARTHQEYPQVAWNGTNWLVVFSTYSLGGTGYYYQQGLSFVRVAPSGQVLDSKPVPIFGVTATTGMWALASDGNNWVVAFEGSGASYDIMATRISPAGVVLDPPNRSFVAETYFVRTNLNLAYAGGVFLLTYDDRDVNGNADTKAVRFDGNLNKLDAAPFSLLVAPLRGLASDGAAFYAVWNQLQPNFTLAVMGSRISTAGAKLDGTGKNISGTHPPLDDVPTRVVWNGASWQATWSYNGAVSVARVSASGQVLDPGGVSLAGLTSGPTAPTSSGGAQLTWLTFANNGYDIFTSVISSGNTAGPIKTLSVGAPSQIGADAATNGSGYMLVYRSSTAATSRILAQPLDASGNPLLFEPIQLDTGGNVTGPGIPTVAWNGALYMVAWANAAGIVAQRLMPNGTPIDATPFVVMAAPNFGPTDIAASGDVFLVVALQHGSPPTEIFFPAAVRVRGSDGVVIDPTPKVIGGSFTTKVRVAAIGSRWIAIWQQNATHDNPSAATMTAFVNADGTSTVPQSVYSYQSSSGAVFDLGLASSGSVALTVQSAKVAGSETDLVARLINADGTMQPSVVLTPWIGNQYRPRAAWDGNQFLVVYQDQKNRLAELTLDQLDARSDLFGMRVGLGGNVVDPQGFVFSASPEAETHPTVAAASGVGLIAGSVMRNETPFANYRVGTTLFGVGGNKWPVSVASASPSDGVIPVTVDFSSAGSLDPDGSIAAYAWDFGDGFTSTGANPSHTYNTAGPFVATLTLTDNGGATSTQTVLVKAVAPNRIPIAAASTQPASGPPPLAVVFYATGSYDPDGFLGNIYWTFGDGSDYYGAIAYHTYDHAGTFPVTVTVYDSQGATGTANATVVVTGANQKPVVMVQASPLSGAPPLFVTFGSAGSYDPDGTIASYSWTFGDGGTSALASPTHTYASAGSYTANLKVTDNLGATAAKSLTITVSSGGCSGTCMRSTDIALVAKGRGTINVTGRVTVKNDANVAISGATVSATWTIPGGSQQAATAVTTNKGIAAFATSGTTGTYTITVTGIVKAGYTFDAANSILTKSITK